MRLVRRWRSPPRSDSQPRLRALPGSANDLWRLLFERHPRPLWIVDTSTGRFLAVNDAAVAHYGFAIDEFLAMRTSDPRIAAGVADPSLDPGEPVQERFGAAPLRHGRKDGQVIEVWETTRRFQLKDRPADLVMIEDASERARLSVALDQERDLLLALMESSADILYVKDRELRFARANLATRRWFGRDRADQIVGRSDRDFFPPEIAEQFAADERSIIATGQPLLNRLERQVGLDNGDRWLLTSKIPIYDRQHRIEGLLGIAKDVTALQQAEAAIRRNEQHFGALLQHASDAVTVVDADLVRRYVSPSIERVTGYTPEEMLGTRVGDLTHPEDRERTQKLFDEMISTGSTQPIQLEVRICHKDGSYRHVEVTATNCLADSNVEGIVLNSRDMTDRKRAEGRLSHLAYHDELTGLPNRSLLINRLQHALARGRRRQARIAVLSIDLDGFKVVNDALGHATGDEVLVAVASRLEGGLRDGDTVARLDGDEFTILAEEIDTLDQALAVAERVLAAIAEPFRLRDREAFVTASAGVAVSQVGDHDPREMLRRADLALDQAKQIGRGSAAGFKSAMKEQAGVRLELEQSLRSAVDRRQLVVHYHPIVDLTSGRLTRMEALVRWNHPERGMMPPAEFVPLAEEIGLIRPIGRWVMREACQEAGRWRASRSSGDEIGVSVNLSARQFRDPHLVDEIAAAIHDADLPPSSVELELTETVLMDEAQSATAMLERLAALGVRLAIDDFGTGYSSLGYLRRFPIDHLKVDRSFIGNTADDHEDTILEAVVRLGHALKLRVTAEGVETADQLARLRSLGFDSAQGYHFARPLDAEEAAAYVTAHALQPVISPPIPT